MRNRPITRYLLLALFTGLLWMFWPLRGELRELRDLTPAAVVRIYHHDTSKVHPIEQLFLDARSKHALTLHQQSLNIDEARNEYMRRYEMAPPPGFDDWYAYAKKRRAIIIDDFDDMMASLRPFRAYQASKCEFQHMQHKHPALMTVCVKNGTVELGNPNPSPYDKKQIVTPLLDMLSDFISHIPDMCFYLNTFDEPRHVIPTAQQAEMISQDTVDTCKDHEFLESKRKDVWHEVIASCPDNSAAKIGSVQTYLHAQEPFLQSWNAATDLCSSPEAPPSGILRCPDTSSLSSGPRPILSAAKLATFSDILFPTLWRWRFNVDNPDSITWASLNDTTPWSNKLPLLGWRGSSTGGYASSETDWRKFQRHQMVSFAASPDLSPTLQSQLDIRFTSITGCEEPTCALIAAELPTAPSQTLTETFANKLVLDMDGHGLSGRLYMLLQSHSAVLKQGLVREWHDSRLVPWLHYIPLSMGMAELEDMLAYLFSDSGDHVLQAIGAAGQEWVRTALRREDMRVYMYRLLLELGRRTF